jgi:xanthine dehydrogenase accessory factor
MEDLRIYEELLRLGREGLPAALATVVETAGSSPRKAGAKMLVRGDGSILGTIGGGRVEAEVIAVARTAIGDGLPRTVPFMLTEEHGFVCGGRLLVYVEPLAAPPRLLVFGAGHVGKALAAAATFAGFRVTVADERPEYASREQVPDAHEVIAGNPETVLGSFPVDAGTYVAVATTDHNRDFAAVRAALRTPARYVGVVGSRGKAEILLRTLAEEGFPPEVVRRVVVPVGLPIGAETPAEIAVSIVAQLVRIRRRNDPTGIRDSSGSGGVAADGTAQAAPARR